jgi:hypothetical protein
MWVTDFFIGQTIFDDLTETKAKIINITTDKNGRTGIWLNNDYLKGGRHPWEITKLEDQHRADTDK